MTSHKTKALYDATASMSRKSLQVLARTIKKRAPSGFVVECVVSNAMFSAGLPNTSGSVRRRGVRSEHDADVIALMRKAGAIPLALTNISELCMWYESTNFVYGCTRNAYHQGRMVGGSSGRFVLRFPFLLHQRQCV
jgi:fatty acid amide hydrolase 2